jgi:hypothetical protein
MIQSPAFTRQLSDAARPLSVAPDDHFWQLATDN